MRYSWSERKNQANLQKHRLAFKDAIRIFEGYTVEREDDRFDYEDIRMYAIGVVNGIEITVVYTDRGEDERRVIAAWPSEPREKRYYWENFKESD